MHSESNVTHSMFGTKVMATAILLNNEPNELREEIFGLELVGVALDVE